MPIIKLPIGRYFLNHQIIDMNLKRYLQAKGICLRWFSIQIGMQYPAFWQFLEKGYSLRKEYAEGIEELTQGDFVSYEDTYHRWGNRYQVKSSAR